MFKKIQEWLILTQTEKRVILFLAITLFIGAGIRLYQKTFASTTQFDYSIQDSIFLSLSSHEIDSVESRSTDAIEKGSKKININVATKQELITLPGIGKVISERIIEYRKEKGGFKTVDDLLNVKGISKKKLEKIKPFITVD